VVGQDNMNRYRRLPYNLQTGTANLIQHLIRRGS